MNNLIYKNKYRIPSTRLHHWDYSANEYYFLTICVKDRKCVLGEIKNNKVVSSKYAEVVRKCWDELPKHYENTDLDEFVIMPNHIHGIVIRRDGACPVSTNKNHTLGNILGSFKSASTKLIHQFDSAFSWQPRFYEHIIRNENSLNKIREYIRLNPYKWDIDEENPKRRDGARSVFI